MPSFFWSSPTHYQFSVSKNLLISTSVDDGVTSSLWAELNNTTKALWVTLLCCARGAENACVSQEELAIKTGCSRPQVSKSIAELKKCGLIEYSKQVVNSFGHRCYRYVLSATLNNEEVPFSSVIVEGGAWSLLCPTAKALYPIVKVCSRPVVDEFSLQDGKLARGGGGMAVRQSYLYCNAEPGVLSELSGFGVRSYQKASKELEREGLIVSIKGMPGGWAVPCDLKGSKSPDELNSSLLGIS